jgi:hypothetical protein
MIVDATHALITTVADCQVPKTEFSRFNGENSKWCKTVCEKYFALKLSMRLGASFTVDFMGNTALWLQSYEAENKLINSASCSLEC